MIATDEIASGLRPPQALRAAMARHAASVAVLTVHAGDRVLGVTISSLISLSLHPPLVLFALHRHSSMLDRLENQPFGLTVLNDGQHDIATRLAHPHRPPVPTAWLQPPLATGEVATIAGGAVAITAELDSRCDAGDHVCVIARVISARSASRRPLLHFLGGYTGVGFSE
ncbi:flavin reductase family protein [Aquabacterium humicola]|uniref:flavin reductase family protein n=1 Tax=Aquabacterium humicola TaxID=3237377 RepID=UPI0025428BC3|nr:flavin reductase family protein [Rubrivivax pictus]